MSSRAHALRRLAARERYRRRYPAHAVGGGGNADWHLRAQRHRPDRRRR